MAKKIGNKIVLFVIYAIIAMIDMVSNIVGIIPGFGDVAKTVVDIVLNTIVGIMFLYILFVMKK